MLNRYDGDLLLSIDENGIDLPFYGGQPTMDRGLINAVLNSLFIRKGYIISKFIGAEKLNGSDFLAACEEPLTISTINNIRNKAIKAIDDIEGTKEVYVSNPNGNRLQIVITIRLPGSTNEEIKKFIFSKKGIYWYYQLLSE